MGDHTITWCVLTSAMTQLDGWCCLVLMNFLILAANPYNARVRLIKIKYLFCMKGHQLENEKKKKKGSKLQTSSHNAIKK